MVLIWILFNVALVLLILLDLSQEGAKKSPTKWCLIWVGLALLFAGAIAFFQGHSACLEFSAAYFMELSLSIDNLFVFYLIFQHFHTPPSEQPKILFWGILGALVMRLSFILAGLQLLSLFHWMLPLFGVFLIIMGAMMFSKKEEKFDANNNIILRLTKNRITPFWATLIAVETTDLLFAIDSIPAVFGITLDPFLAYTSNAFAVLGLRSFYFAMHHHMKRFSSLHYGIAAILVFIGCKMAISTYVKIPTPYTFAIMIAILAASLLLHKKKRN